MAKKSVIARNEIKRIYLVNKYAARRAKLKNISKDPNATDQERWQARRDLQLLPRNASPVRLKNRCQLTGRAHAVYRRVGLCRNKFRELGMRGEIPGLTKASW
jgi:small subunit ribosomal protein S14